MEGNAKMSWAQISEALGTERSPQSVYQHWKLINSRENTPAAPGHVLSKLKAPSTAPHITAIRLSIGLVAFVLLLLANLAQHYWHPTVVLCEEYATTTLGVDWRNRFDPYATGPDGIKKWTPAHEARLQDFSGKSVYLTVCTIFLQALYQGASLLVELLGEASAPRVTAVVYHCTSFFNGFGILVCCMFLFFWSLQTLFHPEWRAQWDFFEKRGYPNYMPLMCLVHLPSLFCGFLDVLSKKPRLLEYHCPSDRHLIFAVTAYHATFETWLFINYLQCGGAIPYPWYYDIALSPYPKALLALYLVGVNTMCCAIVFGFRRFILWWVKGKI